jgi:molybdenum cofactor cytidylyltransferase
MTAPAGLQVIVLAAGASTRFGTPKQLAQLHGVPMLQLVVSRAQALAGHSVSVVLGANAAQVAPALARSAVTLVINRAWEEGLASSIRAGIERVPGPCGGALLLLADQCAVTAADLQRLADLWSRDRLAIASAQYGGTWGVPAIFPRSAFQALLALRGERGARSLLQHPPGRRVGVPMPSAALDVDTVEELRALQASVHAEP